MEFKEEVMQVVWCEVLDCCIVCINVVEAKVAVVMLTST